MFLLSSALCPVLWYLWIHTGSANANFFFAMTLTYALAQVLQFSPPSHLEMPMPHLVGVLLLALGIWDRLAMHEGVPN